MRKDLENYLVLMQKLRDGMQSAIDEANDLAKKGELSQEAAENIAEYFNVVDSNYLRVLYCKYLLLLPPKFIQKILNKLINNKLKKYVVLESNKLGAVEEENKQVIEKVKKFIEKCKE